MDWPLAFQELFFDDLYLEYVQHQGYQTIVTHNHRANIAILALNAKLGFRLVQTDVSTPGDTQSEP